MQRMQGTVDGGMLPPGSLAKEGTIIRAALLIALGVVLAAMHPGLGDERESSGKSGLAAQQRGQRTAASDQDIPARDDSFGAEDHVPHHGALGVSLGKSEEGIVIVGVVPGSPAARAGLRPGDEIRNVDEQRIQTIPELIGTIGDYQPGAKVELSIRRNGRDLIVEATLGAREATFPNGNPSANGVALPTSRAKIGGNPLQGRGPDFHPSAPSAGQRPDGQIGQRMRALEGQIDRLQQELNEVRYTRSARAADAFDASAWWERQHHGQADNDPALFQ